MKLFLHNNRVVQTLNYREWLSLLLVAVFASDFALFGANSEIVPFTPWVWILLFGAGVVPLLLRPMPSLSASRYLLAWIHIYLLISLLSSFIAEDLDDAYYAITNRVLFCVLLIIATLTFGDRGSIMWGRRGFLFVSLFGVGMNFYEFANPGVFSNVLGRSAGWYVDATRSGSALVLSMILCQDILPQRYRSSYQILIGLGVLATFSRGPILCYLIVMIVLLVRDLRNAASMVSTGALILLMAAGLLASASNGIASLQEYWSTVNPSANEWWTRTLTLTSSEQLADDPRSSLLAKAWNIYQERPLFGYGTGSSATIEGGQGTHNMFLSLMIEHGVGGLVIIPALLYCCFNPGGRYRSPAILPFTVFSLIWPFFSHTIMNEWYYAVGVGMVCAIHWETFVRQEDQSPSIINNHRAASVDEMRVAQHIAFRDAREVFGEKLTHGTSTGGDTWRD